MGSDAIANARACSSINNSSQKKRGNKQGKSKQNKINFRREQRLSQVNKEYKGVKNNAGGVLRHSIPKGREGNRTQVNQAMSAKGNEYELSITCYNEAVSWMNDSIVSRLDCNALSKNFNGSRNRSSSGSCSSSFSAEDRDDGCLDDWEAVADALIAENNRQTSNLDQNASKTKSSGVNCRYQGNSQAWSLDDVYRPRSLPSIPKQHYYQNQLNSERCLSSCEGVSALQGRGPSACPICCEEFDVTDSSFLPCPCGFQLCLFCHKRILEADGRCPGCRKQYDSMTTSADITVQPPHFCSKIHGFKSLVL